MATNTTVRPFRQRPAARLALFALLLVGTAAWYVHSRGGWVNALRLPPVLDASTPAAQSGFTLLDVQLPERQQTKYGQPFAGFRYEDVEYQNSYGSDAVDRADAFGIWLNLPPDSLPDDSDRDSISSASDKDFSVTARLSTGETLPLEWHLRNQGGVSTPDEAVQPLVLVSLPSGYADTCRFVDFTAADKHGRSARWRITRLPRMRHAVPPPPAVTETFNRDGITLSAHAWHSAAGRPDGLVSYLLHPSLPPNSHQWDVVTTGQEREWEPFAYDGKVKVYADEGTPILGRNGVFDTDFERWDGGGIRGLAGTDFYPRTTHFLRLACALHQFETYDEPVTFHNVAVRTDGSADRPGDQRVYFLSLPQPLTVTTPSGIAVTLPAQSGSFLPTPFGGALNFFVLVRPAPGVEPTAYPLPRSPLTRRFGKPVGISLTFPPPYELSGHSYEANGLPASYALSLPNNPAWHPTAPGVPSIPLHTSLPAVLKDFTLIVRQRVDLQTIPMTFTLPIADQAPPFFPKGFQTPTRPLGRSSAGRARGKTGGAGILRASCPRKSARAAAHSTRTSNP